MLAVKISVNQRHVQVCSCHKLCTVLHLYKTCHFTFILHVYELPLTPGGGKKVADRWRSFKHDITNTTRYFSWRVDITQPDLCPSKLDHCHGTSLHFQLCGWWQNQVFLRIPGDIQACLWWQKTQIFFMEVGAFPAVFVAIQNKYLQTNHDVFWSMARWFLCPHLTRAEAQRWDERYIQNWN